MDVDRVARSYVKQRCLLCDDKMPACRLKRGRKWYAEVCGQTWSVGGSRKTWCAFEVGLEKLLI